MRKLNLPINASTIRYWLKNTSNNVISSLIASIIITLFIGNTTSDNFTIHKDNVIIISGIVIIITIIVFFLNKIIVQKKYKPIKAIVFDFDGTLSNCKKPGIHSPWELIWKEIGYSVSDCHGLYKKYYKDKTKHQDWCNETCNAFRQKNLTRNTLKKISENFELIEEAKDVLAKLKKRGLKLYLVSGSIKQLITDIWGKDIDNYFDKIEANIFQFENNKLVNIVGTDYDFEGKAMFIKEIYQKNKYKNPSEILFIGNSDNDQSAYKSGAQTLCLNPLLTDHNNKKIWHDSIRIEKYSELLNFIEKEYL